HQRHEVRGCDEVVVGAARVGLAPAEHSLHVRDEDGAHPVEAEALAGFAGDDVLDLPREPALTHTLAPPTGRCSRVRLRMPCSRTTTSSSMRTPPSCASASTSFQSTSRLRGPSRRGASNGSMK